MDVATKVITERNSRGGIKKSVLLVNGEPVPPDKKYCPACFTLKSKEEFSKAGNACRPCALHRAREHHKKRTANKEWSARLAKANKDKRIARKEEAIAYLGGKCLDCSGVFPQVAFDFHHLDPTTKEGHPSWFLNKSGERWKEELSKCVLLCANCHRIRHFGGGNTA